MYAARCLSLAKRMTLFALHRNKALFFVWGKHMDLIQSLMLLFKLKTVTQCVPERTLTLKGQNVKVVVNRL